jgi:xanthine dehydrogenase accessory factor
MKTWALIVAAVEKHGACAMVSVTATQGSAPRDAGARLIVTPEGLRGTIGGGTLEWRAIAAAQAMLGRGVATKVTSHALGPELGQCCGGRVQLATEVFDRSNLAVLRELAARETEGRFTIRGRIAPLDILETFGDDYRRIYLFGAGHVGRALVLALAPLPFDVYWIDPRPGAFPRAVPQNVTALAPDEPIDVLADTPVGSIALVMTHSHALDLAVTDAALRNRRFAHVGLIGSATKRARFEKRLREAGVDTARIAGLICPIGLTEIRSKEPAMIAASTAAQLLVLDERLKNQEMPEEAAQWAWVSNGGSP